MPGFTRCWQILLLTVVVLISDINHLYASTSQDSTEVVAVVPKNFPPHYLLVDGVASGFAIDVMNEIAQLANLRLSYQVRDTWKQVIADLLEGRADIIPNIGISPDRQLKFDFTSPLETFPISIFVRQSSSPVQNIAQLSGLTVAVVESNVAETLLNKHQEIKKVVYVDAVNALFALLSGEVDALVYPKTVLNKIAQASSVINQIKVVGNPILEIKRAIAVKKGSQQLLLKLDKATNQFITSSRYQKIYAKWYGQVPVYWTVVRVSILMGSAFLLVLLFISIWRYISVVRINKQLINNIQRKEQVKEKLRRANKIVENSPAVLFRWRAIDGWPVDYVSDNVTNFGYTPEQFVSGKISYQSIILPVDQSRVAKEVQQFSASGVNQFTQEYRIVTADGDIRWTDDRTWIERDDEGNILHYEGFIIDKTDKKTAEDKLRLSSSVFNIASEGILIINTKYLIVEVNPSCESITGYTKQELMGKDARLFNIESESKSFDLKMRETLKYKSHWQGEIWGRKKSGQVFPVRISVNKVFNEKGKLQNYVAVFYDNTYLNEHEKELKFIAYNDSLTALPNRLLLQDRMQQALAKAKRNDKLIAVCYLDLDGFKPVNDNFGHEAGDQVLIEVAMRLKQVVREGDTVARLGGDEFVLLMHDLANINELERVAERVLEAVAQPYELDETINSVSASLGIAYYPPGSDEPDTLLRYADQAMYKAKQRGKNQFSFFND